MGKLAELMEATYAALRPPAAKSVSEWADQNRILDGSTTAEPGRWKTSRAPYQKEIMDAFTEEGVWQIVIMSSSQVGKSEIELNILGYIIDVDPGPTLYIQPDEDSAEDYSKRRIAPMIQACPSLRKKVSKSKGRDGASTIFMKSFPGGSLAIIGAQSPAKLSSKPVKYILMDETDRFGTTVEGDPQELAERRTETFRRYGRKVVKTSTPTLKGTSRIEKDYMTGTQEEWRTQCPHCGEYLYIQFSDIEYEKEEIRDAEGNRDWVVRNAVWRCPGCKKTSGEYETKRFPGRWVAMNPKAIENGVRSFRLNAFMSPFSDWNDIVHKYLKAGDDPKLLQVFYNTMLGESWEARYDTRLEEKLYARREHYEAEVPRGALVLTMGVDTQDNRLEWEVVGWGRDEESWGICRGVIPGRPDSPGVWKEFDQLLDREWKSAWGAGIRVSVTFVDSGGHYTDEIYRETARRQARRVFAIKGEPGDKSYVRPMKRAKGQGGAMRFLVGVDAGKANIMYCAGVEEPGAYYMHFPIREEAGYDRGYFKGLMSEEMVVRNRKGQSVMEWIKRYERNEPLDMRNYARAAYKAVTWNLNDVEETLRNQGMRKTKTVTRAEETARREKNGMRRVSRGVVV